MESTRRTLEEFYAVRAPEYDRVYEKPERQDDLERLRHFVESSCRGARVLEIGCGTGYWTQFATRSATELLATDIYDSLLARARRRTYPAGRVQFETADMYALPDAKSPYDVVLAAFLWSHVPRARLTSFLRGLRRMTRPGGTLVFMDNRFVAGGSTPVSDTDANGDTFQRRRLSDGSAYRVLKNFPTRTEIEDALDPLVDSIEYDELEYYWTARCRLAGAR